MISPASQSPMIYFAGDYAGHIMYVPNLSGSRATGSPPLRRYRTGQWGQFLERLKIMELVGGPSSPAVNQGHVFYTGGCQSFLGNSGGDDNE
ncbi:hypothetical protein C0J52_11599 [Blattella germanica]|nr:hypothetical protein C0J52_11599 [Blattella germanica]